jgi:hypothetical protein
MDASEMRTTSAAIAANSAKIEASATCVRPPDIDILVAFI